MKGEEGAVVVEGKEEGMKRPGGGGSRELPRCSALPPPPPLVLPPLPPLLLPPLVLPLPLLPPPLLVLPRNSPPGTGTLTPLL